MCVSKRIVQTFAAVAFACGLSLSARAQIGSGWTPFTETFDVQTSNGATATPIAGGYEFKSPNNGAGAVNRAEQRFATMPANSVVQWQGDLLIKSLTGDRIAVKQCHQITISSFLIIDITKAGGTEFIILSGPTLGSYTIGTTIRMTTIMNNKTGVVDIYFNGVHVGSKSGGLGGGGMYDKCGAYVSRSGTGGLDDTWVNLKFWIGGTTSGGTTPPSAPVFSPAAGTYTSAQSVTITSAGSTSIHYTTDGSTPTASSTLYSLPVTISTTTTLSAIGVNSGGSSPVTSGAYTIVPPSQQVAAPTFSPGGGTYTSAQTVTISSATSGASFRYTTDGSTPSATVGTLYSGPVTISATATLNAIAYEAGFTDSAVSSATYTIGNGNPVPVTLEAESLSPIGTGATVSISDDPNASGGVLEFLNSTAAGQSIAFTTPSIAAGTYQLQLRYKTNDNRGECTLKVDGTQVGGTIDEYAATAGYTSVVIGTVTLSTAGTHTLVFTVTGKNSASSGYLLCFDSFTLTPTTSPPPTLNFEAESLSPVGTGATVSISDDANASGGVVEFLNSTAAGQIMTFTTPSIPAGTYQIQLRYWTNTTRGQHTLKIDGVQLGGTLDQYATTKAYLTATFGTVTFSSAATHSIAMTVTGKNSAATQFYITADKFTFVGQ